MSRRAARPSYVYLARCLGLVKIGASSNLKRRLGELNANYRHLRPFVLIQTWRVEDARTVDRFLVKYYGERCPSPSGGCWNCIVWAARDMLSAAIAEIE